MSFLISKNASRLRTYEFRRNELGNTGGIHTLKGLIAKDNRTSYALSKELVYFWTRHRTWSGNPLFFTPHPHHNIGGTTFVLSDLAIASTLETNRLWHWDLSANLQLERLLQIGDVILPEPNPVLGTSSALPRHVFRWTNGDCVRNLMLGFFLKCCPGSRPRFSRQNSGASYSRTLQVGGLRFHHPEPTSYVYCLLAGPRKTAMT